MSVKGVVLETPSLRYTKAGNRNMAAIMNVKQGRWNLANCGFNSTTPIKFWGIINLSRSTKDQIKNLMATVVNMAKDNLNMQMAPAPVFYRDGEYPLEQFLKEQRDDLLNSKAEKKVLNVLFVFIDSPDVDLHRLVKCNFDDLCPTQVLTRSKTPFLNGKDRGYEGHIGNILSKVNQKVGGVNQKLASHQTIGAVQQFLGTSNDTVIMAAACSHPPPGAPGGTRREQIPSVAAMVCSVDADVTQYVHSLRAQAYDRDTINAFEGMVETVLQRRADRFGLPMPRRIIYLKDGVSDSSINALLSAEVEAIKRVYVQLKEPFVPHIVAIAVRRAHQTRFFPTDGGDSRANLPPGTLVFDNLSLPLPHPNFYLLSHAGIKGTSHPARYVVIKDDFKDTDPKLKSLKPGELHKFYAHLMYELCHIYGRCQRTVSMPAPVYYANLLAERGREHISDNVKDFLGPNSSTVGGGGSERGGMTISSATGQSSGSNSATVQESRTVRQLRALLEELNQHLIDLDLLAQPLFYV